MKERDPQVCICIPTYNAGKTVGETIRSLLAQTHENFVIKVVDNASTDGTLGIVREFLDPRISVVEGKSNIGGEGNFNRCIELASGDYTAIFHADDIYEPTILSRQVAEFEANPKVGAVFSDAYLINSFGYIIGTIDRPRVLSRESHVYNFDQIFRSILRHSNFLICPSAMLRTRIYRDEIMRFRAELFGSSADLDVWLRVLERHSISILPERLIRYRISTNQGIHTLGRMRITRSDFFRVIDHYLGREDVQKTLSREDLRNKNWLERTDRIVRASNLFLLDRREETVALCVDAFSLDALHAAFVGKRGLHTILLAAYLRFWLSLPFAGPGKALLRKIKHKA